MSIRKPNGEIMSGDEYRYMIDNEPQKKETSNAQKKENSGKRKHKFLVVDIETTPTDCGEVPYDVGAAICDRHGNIIWKGSFVIQEIFFRMDLMTKAYYSNKISEYHTRLGKGETRMIPFNSLRTLMQHVINTYKPKAMCAYNAAFDNRGLNNGMQFMDYENTFFKEDFPIYDIWGMACQTFMKRKKYIKFCLENELYNPLTGNIKTSAEAAYAYISNNPNFEEEHNGLADVLIECQIMAYAFKCKDKIAREIIPNPWKIPNEQAEKWDMKPALPQEIPDMPAPRTKDETLDAMSMLLDEEVY